MRLERLVITFGIAWLLIVLVLFAVSAHALPTPIDRTLAWDHVGGADGFWLYYAPEVDGRTYDNTRRVEILGGVQRGAVVLDLTPATGRLCFKLTAYLGAVESDFSNEACGFFGIPSASNLRTGP